MAQAAMHEEIINEIGTQTLARLGLNIFNLNTLDAYDASTKGTSRVFKVYNQHKKNPNYFGQTFEDLDVTKRNIQSELHKKGTTFHTTDQLAELGHSEGKINDPVTDVKELNDKGEVVTTHQHKVIKRSKDLFGKNNKYLENDKIVVSSDSYEEHKNYLESMAENSKDPETRKNALEMLSKLEKSDISKNDAENARTTSIKIQSKQAASHVVQAGISDAVVVALSTLANGAISEIKDAFTNNEKVSVTKRIKRLLKKVLNEFYKTFKRGASFGALEIGILTIEQIFKSVFTKVKVLFKQFRTSLKSIYNAIYSYITGEIKSYQELISAIIKGLLSAVLITASVTLETKLEIFLAPLVSPLVASFLAPALSIIVGAIAVIVSMRSIDVALNALFGALSQKDLAKMKAEKIKSICEELLPDLINEKEDLRKLIEETYRERKLTFNNSFAEFSTGISSSDTQSIINGLSNINCLYGKKLQFATFEEFDSMMLCDEAFKL